MRGFCLAEQSRGERLPRSGDFGGTSLACLCSCRSRWRRAMVRSTSDHARLQEPVHGPGLVLRFALYSGFVLLAAGVAIFWAVNREIAQRAERTVQAQATAIARDSLKRRLRTS